MCDETIHVGKLTEPAVSRRTFGLMAVAAAGYPAAVQAADAKVVERDVEVKTPDGSADAVLFHPAGKGAWPAVLVWTDAMGLRPAFRDMGRRLAGQGYVVLIPNPYYRSVRGQFVGPGFDFGKP